MLGKLPKTKPEGLSKAMQRLYDVWPAQDDRENEFFTNFKYSRISGVGKDKNVSRRDPTKIIKEDGLYYVWYTRRETISEPVGMDNCSDVLPAVDWDLAEIWYATSTDGFDWQEQGVAVQRAAPGEYGDRSATTPDILVFNNKYYLYFQSFSGSFSNDKGDHCDVSMAWSDSPMGPWTRSKNTILSLGADEDWDGGAIHDPYPLVYKGKIWLFYKGQPATKHKDWLVRAQGVAIADNPEGPFIKPAVNPLLNSGHETFLFPYKEGIAAMLCVDGPEKNTIQYAADGINFQIMSSVTCPPVAGGPFCPDAFSDNGDGKGVTWGLSHISESTLNVNDPRRVVESNSFLVRFDCNLHRDSSDAYFKNPRDQVGRYDEATFFQPTMALEEHVKAELLAKSRIKQ